MTASSTKIFIMNYIELGKKLFNYYFNEDKKGKDVILYVDDDVLNDLYKSEHGHKHFQKLLISRNLFQVTINGKTLMHPSIVDVCSKFCDLNENESISINNGKNINRTQIKRDNLSKNPAYYFPYVILLIYTYQKGENSIGATEYERIYNLLVKLKDFLTDKKIGQIPLHNNLPINLFDIYSGTHRYSGCFKFHVPFTRQQITEILKIKTKNGIYHEITDNGTMDLLFKEILDSRFKGRFDIGYRQINNVITGVYKIPKKNRFKNKIDENNLSDDFTIIPAFYRNGEKINYLLRIHSFNSQLNEVVITLDGKEYMIYQTSGYCYSEVKVVEWPKEIRAKNLNIDYICPFNMFYIPIKFNHIWSTEIYREEFIASEYNCSENINYFISRESLQKPLVKLQSKDPNGNWKQLDDNLFYSLSSKMRLIIKNDRFSHSSVETSTSAIKLLDNGFYIDKYGGRISYLYYFLPKIEILKQDNEKCFYQVESEDQVEICTNIFDLNSIQNLKGGQKIAIFVINDQNQIVINKSLDLVLERDQLTLNNINVNPSKTIRTGYPLKEEISEDLSFLDKDYLSRILYSLSGYSLERFKLNKKQIYKIIDEVCIKKGKPEFIHKRIEKKQVFRNLIALGYIKEDKLNGIFTVRDLALIQVNRIPNPNPNYNFQYLYRLSGARNLPFIKKLIAETKKEVGVRIEYKKKDDENEVSSLMPFEIYFLFKDLNQYQDFLKHPNSKFFKTIPYEKNSCLISNKPNTIELFRDNNDIEIYHDVFDENNLNLIIDGGTKLFKLINQHGENGYERYFIFEKKIYIETQKKEWAVIYVLTKNNIPIVYSRYLGGKEGDHNELYIICPNTNALYKESYYDILPIEYYSDLIYISGSVPVSISIEKNVLIYETEDGLHPMGKLQDIIKSNYFLKFKNIDRSTRELMAKKLNSKIGFIQL
jgi:hypothetical protein